MGRTHCASPQKRKPADGNEAALIPGFAPTRFRLPGMLSRTLKGSRRWRPSFEVRPATCCRSGQRCGAISEVSGPRSILLRLSVVAKPAEASVTNIFWPLFLLWPKQKVCSLVRHQTNSSCRFECARASHKQKFDQTRQAQLEIFQFFGSSKTANDYAGFI